MDCVHDNFRVDKIHQLFVLLLKNLGTERVFVNSSGLDYFVIKWGDFGVKIYLVDDTLKLELRENGRLFYYDYISSSIRVNNCVALKNFFGACKLLIATTSSETADERRQKDEMAMKRALASL